MQRSGPFVAGDRVQLTDTKGRKYTVVLTEGGEELGRVLVPHTVSNLCFGGPEGRTLYMTATSELWAIETNVHG